MTSNNHKESEESKAFLDRLTDFLGDSENQTMEEVQAELDAQGLDIDNMITEIKNMVSAAISEKRREWLKEAPRIRERMRKQIEDIDIPDDIDTIRDEVKQFTEVGEQRQLAEAFFRNYEELRDDDLKRLYKDYLKLLKMKEADAHDEESG